MVAASAGLRSRTPLGITATFAELCELFHLAPIHRDLTERVALERQRGAGRFDKVPGEPLAVGEQKDIGSGFRTWLAEGRGAPRTIPKSIATRRQADNFRMFL